MSSGTAGASRRRRTRLRYQQLGGPSTPLRRATSNSDSDQSSPIGTFSGATQARNKKKKQDNDRSFSNVVLDVPDTLQDHDARQAARSLFCKSAVSVDDEELQRRTYAFSHAERPTFRFSTDPPVPPSRQSPRCSETLELPPWGNSDCVTIEQDPEFVSSLRLTDRIVKLIIPTTASLGTLLCGTTAKLSPQPTDSITWAPESLVLFQQRLLDPSNSAFLAHRAAHGYLAVYTLHANLSDARDALIRIPLETQPHPLSSARLLVLDAAGAAVCVI